jgi:hypothetical protein
MDLSQLPVPVTGNWDVRKSLKICDFLSDTGEPKSQQDFEVLLQCNLQNDEYLQIKTSLIDSCKKVSRCKIVTSNTQVRTVENFLKGFKKGSKPIRKILEKFRNEKKKY